MKRTIGEKKSFKRGKAAVVLTAVVLLAGLAAGGVNFYNQQKTDKKTVTAMEQLSEEDRELSSVYARLYEVSEEDVAKLKLEIKDWERVNERLDSEYFTISENEKAQMAEDGYALEDLYQAEKLARKTGKRAIDLAKAKGKNSEGKAWSEVVAEEEILTTEEQLGLTKKQIKQLKKRKIGKDKRIEIAILCLNESYSFEEIMDSLEQGKTLKELQENKQS